MGRPLPSWDEFWPCYSCCQEFWLPSLGTFGPQCLGVVGQIPLWTAVVVVTLRYGSGPVWHRRPPWLRRFASEKDCVGLQDEETGEDGLSLRKAGVWTLWGLALLLLSLAAVASGVVGAIFFSALSPVLSMPVVPGIISALILVLERPRTLPGSVFVINFILLLVQLFIPIVVPDLLASWQEMVALCATTLPPLGSLIVMLNMPMRDPLLDSTGIGKPFQEPNSSVRSPEDLITLWQWMTVSWMAPLIKVGYKRQLHDGDVWFLAYEFHHDRIHHYFRELTGTVFVRLMKANGLDLLITTGLSIFETLCEFAEPLLLKELLAALAAETPDTKVALIYAGITLFVRLVRAQTAVLNMWYQRRNYERSRGEMITMIYEKTLRRKAFTFPSGDPLEPAEDGSPSPVETPTPATLADSESEGLSGSSQDTLKPSKLSWLKTRLQEVRKKKPPAPPPEPPASTGKILNLLRGDVYEVAQRFWEFPSITTKPLNFFISIALLWRILGPASLSGIFILALGMSINAFLMRWMIQIETIRRAITDTKLQRTSQFVESIRHLRWYSWQDAWLTHIMASRRAELSKRVASNIIAKAIGSVNALAAYLFPVAGFLAYTLLSGRALTVDVAFPALNLFAMLQTSLRELPDLLTVLLNAQVAMRRIEAFMLEPDKDEPLLPTTALSEQHPLEITLTNATFSFPGNPKRKILRNVTLALGPGLTLITGRVGAGKSALLQALLGELDLHPGGAVAVPQETIGYCAQSPWLESMSIRENILFCAPYHAARFNAVIEACQLRDDLERFKAKDRTMIGENGVGLSGGQRARVALARAVYSRARVLVLDDPVAALDHGTAVGILEGLFGEAARAKGGLMEGRLVVLVTHRVEVARGYADLVVEVERGGRVAVVGKGKLVEMKADETTTVTGGDEERTVEALDGHEEESPADKFMEEEHRVHGGVLASVYWQYVKAGRLGWWATVIVLFVLYRAAAIGYYWFLKEWGEGYTKSSVPSGLDFPRLFDDGSPQTYLGHPQVSTTATPWLDLTRYLPSPSIDVRPWLWCFLFLSLAQVLTQTLADGALIVIIYAAGKNLFELALHRVSAATFRFYDVTPVGRLMNRLTSDMGTVDGPIANQVMQVALHAISWLSSMAVIASATPTFLVLSVAMTALFVVIFDRFLPTSQSLRRLETVSLSPLMSNFGALVEGLTTVRAFRAADHFQRRIVATTDAFQRMDHIYWSLQAWLQIRFDALSAVTTFALTVTAVLSGLSGGAVGFVLAAASNFVQSTHSLCRRYGEMQMQFVSVERVVELLSLEQEPRGEVVPPAGWPRYGDDIVFDAVTLRYAEGLDAVLADVDLRIPGGANVAVTGRTGSGKSTLALSLLGTLHPDAGGMISIGGVDLRTVDKHVLRRNITFVAQDPVLFPGTMRDNLDPLEEWEEGEREGVLQRVLGGEFSLDSRVDAGGKNLSQGQRQLVGLGRAMLRRSPVVVMDEATASIDKATAAEIQRLLREELRESTVITIAHKKEAVEGADWEVVLSEGRVVRAGPLGDAASSPDEGV